MGLLRPSESHVICQSKLREWHGQLSRGDRVSRNWLLAMPLLIGWAVADAAQPSALVGIVTQITGAVQVTGLGATGDPLASTWQVVRAGATVRVPAGGAAGIVCSTGRFI